MQILITGDGEARTRVLQLSRARLAALVAGLLFLLLALSGTVYHFIFLAAARDGWPVVSQLVKLVVRDEFAQRDRFMRENLDAMAVKVGDMQARMIRLEAMGDRLTGLAGVKAEELQPRANATAGVAPASGAGAVAKPGVAAVTPNVPRPAGVVPPAQAANPLPRASGAAGGPYLPLEHPTLQTLQLALEQLEQQADLRADVFLLTESRLFEKRLASLMQPSTRPIAAPMASGFGFRSDPFTGRAALHTGLDFQANPGASIVAAAGGVVAGTEWHPQYGQLLEIDHGNGLSTRYAHTSKILVAKGDLVKRGQQVALVGNTGRSTGPHLHFEVLIDGVPQNPARFLGPEALR